MKSVRKYVLDQIDMMKSADKQSIYVPGGAVDVRLVAVDPVTASLAVWLEVDDQGIDSPVTISVCATGATAPDGAFLGSCFVGVMARHVYVVYS